MRFRTKTWPALFWRVWLVPCNAGGALLVLAEEENSEFIEYSLARSARSPGQTQEPPATFRSATAPVSEGILSL